MDEDMNKQRILAYLEEYVISMWNRQEPHPFTQQDWEACFLKEFSEREKNENEAVLNEFLKKTKHNRFDFEGFLASEGFLHIEQYMGKELFQDYLINICLFLKRTKEFDSNLSVAQIWQALRNYYIYGMITAMVCEKQTFHEAIMSFSLLYPYTDNYIDNPDISEKEKKAFNHMIYKTLCGEDISVTDDLQQKTKQCLISCLNYRNGSKFQEASELLLLMLDAQAESTEFMGTLSESDKIDWDKVLNMLAYKGGMSVLIDYFYSVPDMKENAIIFYLQFGLILQLADDIQDIQEDRESDMKTLYSQVDNVWQREQNLFRLMRFTMDVFQQYNSENEQIRRFMLRNCMLLYEFAVLRSEEFFSEKLINEMEPYLPFHKDYARKLGQEFRFSEDMPKQAQERWFTLVDSMCEQVLGDDMEIYN